MVLNKACLVCNIQHFHFIGCDLSLKTDYQHTCDRMHSKNYDVWKFYWKKLKKNQRYLECMLILNFHIHKHHWSAKLKAWRKLFISMKATYKSSSMRQASKLYLITQSYLSLPSIVYTSKSQISFVGVKQWNGFQETVTKLFNCWT